MTEETLLSVENGFRCASLCLYEICLVFLPCIFSVLSAKQVREARIISAQGCESIWDENQMRELPY